jgi:hypothetical protein
MKIIASILAALVSFVCSPQRLLAQTQVDIHKLGKDFVIIGDLGVPLGTVVEINATIVAGSSLGWKDVSLDYLLKVIKVGSNSLANSPTCEFKIHPWDDVKIAPNAFALYELKNGKKIGSLSSSQISELERGYVGKNYRLLVYEEGMFTGVPEHLPEDYVVWQDRPFGFRSHLIVLRILDESETPNPQNRPNGSKPMGSDTNRAPVAVCHEGKEIVQCAKNGRERNLRIF